MKKVIALIFCICLNLIPFFANAADLEGNDFTPLNPQIILLQGSKLYAYSGDGVFKATSTNKSETKASIQYVICNRNYDKEIYYKISNGYFVRQGSFKWLGENKFWEDKASVKIDFLKHEKHLSLICYTPIDSLKSDSFYNGIYCGLLNTEIMKFRSIGNIGDGIKHYGHFQLDNDIDEEIVIVGGAGASGAWEQISIVDLIKDDLFFKKVESTGYGEFPSSITDLDNNGSYEILVPSLLKGYEGAETFGTWVDIYNWNGKELVNTSRNYPDYYKTTYIPELKKIRDRMPTIRDYSDEQKKLYLERLDSLIKKAETLLNRN